VFILDLKNENHKQVYDTAIKFLTRREHTKKEISLKLIRKYPQQDELIDSITNFLTEKDYLSESRFAEMIFRARTNQLYGFNRVFFELKEKGLEDNLINEIISPKDSIWRENIALLIKKKTQNILISDIDRKQKNKLIKFLMGKGYNYELVKSELNIYIKNNSV